MHIRDVVFIAVLAAAPAIAEEAALDIKLIPGHPIHHESKQEAGVAMALWITPGRPGVTDLMALCEELRLGAGLAYESGGLRLETIFVVPYKAMAIEGLYLPSDNTSRNALVRGKDMARASLDGIVARAGIPPRILDEAKVEQEISCTPGEPSWVIAWTDLRPIGEEDAGAVIERAQERFLAVHQSVLAYNGADQPLRAARRASHGG